MSIGSSGSPGVNCPRQQATPRCARLHPLGEIDLDDMEDMLRVNIHPTIQTVQTVQALLPGLKAKGEAGS